MENSRKWIAALLGATIAGFAVAETPSEELTRIETETLLLKAREKQLEAQASVLNRQSEIAQRQGYAGAGMGGGARLGALPPPGGGRGITLRGIESLGGAKFATLELNNSQFDVRPGDMLPNGMRVSAIQAGYVTLRDEGGRTMQLTVSTAGSGAAMADNGSSVPALPMPMPAAFRGVAR